MSVKFPSLLLVWEQKVLHLMNFVHKTKTTPSAWPENTNNKWDTCIILM